LSGKTQETAQQGALTAAMAIQDRARQAATFRRVVSVLPKTEAWIKKAVTTVSNVTDVEVRVGTLASIAGMFPEEMLAPAIQDALTEAGKTRVASSRHDYFLIAAALSKGNEQIRAWRAALEALGAVTAPLLFRMRLREFVQAATRPETWFMQLSELLRARGDHQLHAETLRNVVMRVAPDERLPVAREAVDAARRVTAPQQRCGLLVDLAPHLPGDEQTNVWREAMTAADGAAMLPAARNTAEETRATSGVEPRISVFDRLLINVPDPLIGEVLSRRTLPLGPAVWQWFAQRRFSNHSTTDAVWDRLLRETAAAERPPALDMITALAGRLREDAGDDVVMEVVQAVRQVTRWRG
jgi:hypothetical protein